MSWQNIYDYKTNDFRYGCPYPAMVKSMRTEEVKNSSDQTIVNLIITFVVYNGNEYREVELLCKDIFYCRNCYSMYGYENEKCLAGMEVFYFLTQMLIDYDDPRDYYYFPEYANTYDLNDMIGLYTWVVLKSIDYDSSEQDLLEIDFETSQWAMEDEYNDIEKNNTVFEEAFGDYEIELNYDIPKELSELFHIYFICQMSNSYTDREIIAKPLLEKYFPEYAHDYLDYDIIHEKQDEEEYDDEEFELDDMDFI
ncbi:MAG: hypothetical protein IKO47_00160 [Ruminococcus sp.]|nr:hypothetical protein [Ruminococcus sp.]